MKIGVMSDTHDQLANTLYVLNTFRERNIETVIHCGDLTGLEMVSHFSGFRVIYTHGNMDYATGAIQARFHRLHEDNFVGTVFRGELGGNMVAATHSHISNKVMDLIRAGKYKWLFHGHTHERRNEIIRGTHVVNPGALGGLSRGARTFCIVDLLNDDVEFLEIP
jgi:putative phosphoesterase